MVDVTTNELQALFYDAFFSPENCCPAIYAGWREVNDDPECPPYDVQVMRCTALDDLL